MPADLLVKNRAYWVEWQLQNWAIWMRGDEGPEGCPRSACGGVEGYTHMDVDASEHSYEKLDLVLAEATNAAIEGLESPAEQCAIYRHYQVAAVYHLRDFASTLALAKLHVAESLERRGIWLGD